MVTVVEAFLLAVGVAAIAIISVIVGGWLVFKSKAKPGETFIGPVPKGEVFKIPDPVTNDYPEEEQLDPTIAKRTEQFMERLLGGKA